MERAWLRSDGRFGARLVGAAPGREGVRLTPCRVRKIARGLGIRGVVHNARKATTAADPDALGRPDLVGWNFCPAVPMTVFCGDMTHLKTGEGWPCLAIAVDLRARAVVGWSASGRTGTDLVVSALRMVERAGYVAGARPPAATAALSTPTACWPAGPRPTTRDCRWAV